MNRWLEQDDLDCKIGDDIKCIFNGKLVKGEITDIFNFLGGKVATVFMSRNEFFQVPLKFIMKDE